MRAPQIAVIAMLAAAVLQLAYFYPQLPAVVASHFNAAGEANSWQPKALFVGTLGVLDVLFAMLYLAIPRLVMLLPPALINLPNKNYWLATERRRHTASLLGDQLAWLGVAQIGFMTLAGQLAINANLPGGTSKLGPGIFWISGLFLIFLLLWTARLYAMFARTSG